MTNRTMTALVVEDDLEISELLEVLLTSIGFEVEVVRDGIHVVVVDRWYDVILLDMKMPIFDGERLAEYWKATQPEILERVIVLSGYSRLTAGRFPSTFATLSKPFDHDTLVSLVQSCAAQPRRQ